MATKRLRGVSVYRPIIFGNTAVLLEPHEKTNTDHTHRWTVGVRSATSADKPDDKQQSNHVGGADDLSYFIKKVTFKLHDTYPQPLRTIERPPFEVTETGWGEFDIIIKIFFVPEAAEKPLTFTHHLKLHPWPLDLSLIPPPPPPATTTTTSVPEGETTDANDDNKDSNETQQTDAEMKDVDKDTEEPDAANDSTTTTESLQPAPPPAPPSSQQQLVLSPVHSWQYEEIVFVEPVEQFYAILLSNPPTSLPNENRFPKIFKHQLSIGGNFGEFNLKMELDERDRMEKARLQTFKEIESLKLKLIQQEKELTALKKEVEDIQASHPAAIATPMAT
ncbi:NuA4 histone H4 acetyltransferase complex and the SWR1 complex subunit [Microbotryomycetes sp. JL221]|nr:NuA4 histone H4 acetyltransferase complex and the SWR1 complex subunit [Microbotryomycetes sp. JL221]